MSGYNAFIKKELKENIRNYKFFILLITFAIIGVLSPLTAKFLPVLLENLMDANITIIVLEPTYVDSWMQFFSNINQIGLVIVVLIFSPILSKEYEKGTLVHMVTKGLSRWTIYTSKASLLIISWTVFYWLSFLITLVYTSIYFSDSTTDGLGIAAGTLYLFGILLLMLLLAASTLVKNTFGPLLVVGCFIGLSFVINLIPAFIDWNPIQLALRNTEWLMGIKLDTAIIQSSGMAMLLSVALFILGGTHFRKSSLQ